MGSGVVSGSSVVSGAGCVATGVVGGRVVSKSAGVSAQIPARLQRSGSRRRMSKK